MKKKKIQKTGVGIIKNMSGNIPGGNFPGWGNINGNISGGSFPDMWRILKCTCIDIDLH